MQGRSKQLGWRPFLIAPVLLVVAVTGLLIVSVTVGSALLAVFIYSFVIMTPIAVYSYLRGVGRRTSQ